MLSPDKLRELLGPEANLTKEKLAEVCGLIDEHYLRMTGKLARQHINRHVIEHHLGYVESPDPDLALWAEFHRN